MSEGEGFLSRWSRRKRASGAAPVSPPTAAPAPPEAAASGGAPASGAKPAFDSASLPPVESLTAESDFAAFLREEVPAALRQAALRRAWTLDPAIRDFTGPADYAWDYNAPGGVPGFSFDLPGDVRRLVAQAIGSGPPPTRGEGEAPSPAGAAAPSVEPAPPEDPPPGEALLAVASVDEPAPPEALPAPASVPAAPIADVPPARRRHGGALPS